VNSYDAEEKLKELKNLLELNPAKAVEEFVSLGNSPLDPVSLETLVTIGTLLLDKLDDSMKHEKGRVLGTLGNLYYSLGKFEDAERMYLDTLQIYIDLSKENDGFMKYVGGALFNLGNLYQTRKKYEEAEKAYRDAIRVFEISDSTQLPAVLTSLGTMHTKMGKFREAENYFLKAFEHRRRLLKNREDVRELGVILNNLAVIYMREKRAKEAEILLKKAFEMFEKAELIEELASVIQNLLSLVEPDDDLLTKLEMMENRLSPDLAAKIKFIKAKNAEKRGNTEIAASYYTDAACLSFIAYRNFGFQSVNFIHCFEKARELGTVEAETIKNAILRVYFGASVEFSLDELRKISNSDSLLSEVAGIILNDIFS
jgi:tetratricopeptide (TPR) repeat protein